MKPAPTSTSESTSSGPFRGVGDHRSREPGVRPVRDVARGHRARPHALAGLDAIPGLAGHIQIAPHVPDPGYAVGYVDPKGGLEKRGKLVDVHVPQARDEIPAATVDALDAFAEEQIRGRRHGGDPGALDNHGSAAGYGARRRIHDGYVLDRGAGVEFAGGWTAGQRECRHRCNEVDTRSHEEPLGGRKSSRQCRRARCSPARPGAPRLNLRGKPAEGKLAVGK